MRIAGATRALYAIARPVASTALRGVAIRRTLLARMRTRRITKADFDRIVEVIDQWWGGPISTFAHPIFFYELGAHALIAEDPEAGMIGFLLGFVAEEPERTGYVHLVGIHPEFRRRGVGRLLYQTFIEECRSAGCKRMKAITTLGYEGSIKFHVALGWQSSEVADYAGRDRARLVFTREL
jgi:GNAT superfamily N-acetyltransferase